MHGVLNGQLDQISGDIPGATSRYIEESLDDDAVAVWSTGASGDQNPIYFQQTYDLREIRIKEYASRGLDIGNSMPPGGQGLNKRDPKVAKLMNQQRQMTVSMGQMLGEEVLHVMRSNLERPTLTAQIAGAQKTVSCPGRKRTDSGRAGYPGSYVDADPIPIRSEPVEDRRCRPGRCRCRGIHGHRAAVQARLAAEALDDGDVDERDGAVRLHPR